MGLPLVAPAELDPFVLRPRGVGELLLAALREQPRSVLVGVGGTATVDGGAGLREVLLPGRVRFLCASRATYRARSSALAAPHGSSGRRRERMRRRSSSSNRGWPRSSISFPFRDLPGAGAGGGLGAGLAALGGELVPGAELVLDRDRIRRARQGRDVVITGEGTVDATTTEGKAAGAVVRRCAELGVRCELFGGVVRDGIQAHALSGDPTRAVEDLVSLGERLGELSSRRDSSSIRPRTLSSFAAQIR